MSHATTPTEQAYTELRTAYDFFNQHLFGDELSPCLITLQRKTKAYGYFSGNRWTDRERETITDEIALNPQHSASRSLEDILSTLVHEMAHLWQHHFGDAGRRGYHNRAWAAKMKLLGLYPSRTGQPGGKETGERMSHYVMEMGPFAVACAELLASGLVISWLDRGGLPGVKAKPTRTKYMCLHCGLNTWAKPDVLLLPNAEIYRFLFFPSVVATLPIRVTD